MFENSENIIKPSGLDTLSENALRRLTDRWTGSLHEADTLLDERSMSQATSGDTFSMMAERWRKAREVYHDADQGAVFGEQSVLADGVGAPLQEPVAAVDSLGQAVVADAEVASDDIMREVLLSASDTGIGEWMPLLYDVLVVAAVIYYIFCLYRYFDDIAALFHSVFQRQVVSNDRTGERRRSDIFYGTLGKLFMMGGFFVGLLVAMSARRTGAPLSMEQMFYLPFVVVGVFVLVICVQYVMLAIIGFLTRSMGEVSALMRIRLIYFVLAALLVAPILLVAQMGDGGGYEVWQKVGLIAAFIAFVLFVRESVGFFISKKVSILHWFLYLCTVEILPLTLLWQGVVRLA